MCIDDNNGSTIFATACATEHQVRCLIPCTLGLPCKMDSTIFISHHFSTHKNRFFIVFITAIVIVTILFFILLHIFRIVSLGSFVNLSFIIRAAEQRAREKETRYERDGKRDGNRVKIIFNFASHLV